MIVFRIDLSNLIYCHVDVEQRTVCNLKEGSEMACFTLMSAHKILKRKCVGSVDLNNDMEHIKLIYFPI